MVEILLIDSIIHWFSWMSFVVFSPLYHYRHSFSYLYSDVTPYLYHHIMIKDNLLSAEVDHIFNNHCVSNYYAAFYCDSRVISIGYLPAVFPTKGWISLHNYVTYTHNSGIRKTYVREISSFHTQFFFHGLPFIHFCKLENGKGSIYASWSSFTFLH